MTCGNGRDTAFLASHMVNDANDAVLYAFDIQERALFGKKGPCRRQAGEKTDGLGKGAEAVLHLPHQNLELVQPYHLKETPIERDPDWSNYPYYF